MHQPHWFAREAPLLGNLEKTREENVISLSTEQNCAWDGSTATFINDDENSLASVLRFAFSLTLIRHVHAFTRILIFPPLPSLYIYIYIYHLLSISLPLLCFF